MALEALRGDKTVQEIAASGWKRQALDGLSAVFSNGLGQERQDHETEIGDLHANRAAGLHSCRASAELRRDQLTRQIGELLPNWSMAPVAMAVQAMRGVALVVAVTVVAEVGDFRRFVNARQLMAYLGLTPSEHSSGSSIRRAGITKAGNSLARRVLIEGIQIGVSSPAR